MKKKKPDSGNLRIDDEVRRKYNPYQFHYTLDMSSEVLVIGEGSTVKIFGHNEKTCSKLPMEFKVKKDTEVVIRSHETDINQVARNLEPISNYEEIEKENQKHFEAYMIKEGQETIKQLEEQVYWNKQNLEKSEKRLKEWKEKIEGKKIGNEML